MPGGSCTLEQIVLVVETNDKKRFALQEIDGVLHIRANQGHTVQVKDLALEKVTSAELFPTVIHGTFFKFWRLIAKSGGLSRMTRNHIHFAIGEPGSSEVISGMRKTCDILIFIDLAKALSDGFEFFLSENRVMLSPGNQDGFLPTTYFLKVLRMPDRTSLSLQEASSSSSSSSSSNNNNNNASIPGIPDNVTKKKKKKKKTPNQQQKQPEKGD